MRRMFSLVLVMALMVGVFALPASAAEVAAAADPRAITVIPDLSIDGNLATCEFTAVGNSSSDYLVATIELCKGNLPIVTWGAVGYGHIFFSQPATIVPGYTYTLKVTLTVNGTSVYVPQVSK